VVLDIYWTNWIFTECALWMPEKEPLRTRSVPPPSFRYRERPAKSASLRRTLDDAKASSLVKAKGKREGSLFFWERPMHHEEEYKGHTISVYTTELGRGHIWNYQIDGGAIRRQYGDRPQSEETALHEGIGEAKYAVDQITKAK
jgi:hypothetical protein